VIRDRVLQLVDELDRERARFMDALAALPPEGVDSPVVDGWTARDLVWHCGYWSDHGADAMELALAGRGGEFNYDSAETNAMNASETDVGRRQDPSRVRLREDRAYARFRDALARLADDLLDVRLGNGDTVERVIRYDGPDHYAEHASQLEAAAN
jgi:hypothetical protein